MGGPGDGVVLRAQNGDVSKSVHEWKRLRGEGMEEEEEGEEQILYIERIFGHERIF